jgi:pyruvate dehydrogenase E1 component alpha subunit
VNEKNFIVACTFSRRVSQSKSRLIFGCGLAESGGVMMARKKRVEAHSDDIIEMAFEIARLRRLDERLTTLQRQGRIGFHGSTLGEEACVVGCGFALRPDDWVFPALRQNAIMLHRGFALDRYLAQDFGCALDDMHGRQMPTHNASREVCQVSWSSCIGNQVPQAVGAAYAARALGHTQITVGFMGDGATSEADFHCAMTFAGVWKVPCVLICQNNQWAISEPLERQTRVTELYRKAEAYGVRGVRCNGQDVQTVRDTVHEAAERARRGEGPTFVELVTFRVGPHSTSDDPSVYRDEVKAKAWFADNDPLLLAMDAAQRHPAFSRAAFDAKMSAFEISLDAALRKLEAVGLPEKSTLFEDVYAEETWHLIEQKMDLLS